MSRPALYLLFDNKEDVFRSLSRHLQQDALAAAQAALGEPKPFAERLADAVAVKLMRIFEVIYGSPHGAELFDTNTAIAGDINLETEARFVDLIAGAIGAAAETGEVDLSYLEMTPARLAELLVSSVQGVKSAALPAKDLEAALRDLVKVFAAPLALAAKHRKARAK
jgi:AcrR family transcriptional regulator